MFIGRESPFEPKGSNRAEAGTIEGQPIYWYRGQVSGDPNVQVRETLLKAREMVAWKGPRLGPNRALGVACGIFACGVLDAFLSQQFNPFDICIGVSAGTTNIAAYLAGMYKRNHKVYLDYSLRKDFISWKRFFRGGHLLDLDWMWDITIREVRLKVDEIEASRSLFLIGLTNARTGQAEFIAPKRDEIDEHREDVDGLASAIVRLLEHESERRTMGEASKPCNTAFMAAMRKMSASPSKPCRALVCRKFQ